MFTRLAHVDHLKVKWGLPSIFLSLILSGKRLVILGLYGVGVCVCVGEGGNQNTFLIHTSVLFGHHNGQRGNRRVSQHVLNLSSFSAANWTDLFKPNGTNKCCFFFPSRASQFWFSTLRPSLCRNAHSTMTDSKITICTCWNPFHLL